MRYQVALWAALAAFFGNLVALELVKLIATGTWARLGASIIVSFFVGAMVYSRERLNEARRPEDGSGSGETTGREER